MQTLKEVIADAKSKRIAIGHFNISTLDQLWAIFNSAKALNLPVIIGTAEGEKDFIGAKQAVALVKGLREQYNYPIYLNADHHYSFDKVREAVDAGYDAVIFDGAKLSFEDNIEITKQCVEYARSVNPDILVEGELGYIGGSSKILDAIPEGAAVTEEELTTVDQAVRFIKETAADLFSPAVGSIHGMLRSAKDPDLNIKRIAEISSAVETPLVLHGGSGLSDENFRNAILAGISVIHINTEIRLAWQNAVKLAIQENPDEVAPYKILKNAVVAVGKVVTEREKLFSNP
ncbi:MAG: class II fructose-bisphosphate aldolase [bacterium]